MGLSAYEVYNLETACDDLREQIERIDDCREKSLALTKLDECELWLGRIMGK